METLKVDELNVEGHVTIPTEEYKRLSKWAKKLEAKEKILEDFKKELLLLRKEIASGEKFIIKIQSGFEVNSVYAPINSFVGGGECLIMPETVTKEEIDNKRLSLNHEISSLKRKVRSLESMTPKEFKKWKKSFK